MGSSVMQRCRRIKGTFVATTASFPIVRRKMCPRRCTGVGFRPFVYNLARSLDLSGYVLNSSSDVTIEIEGTEPQIDEFTHVLRNDPPPRIECSAIAAAQQQRGFTIRQSVVGDQAFVLVFDGYRRLRRLPARVWRPGQPTLWISLHKLHRRRSYPFCIDDTEPMQIDMRPAIENIVRDIAAGTPAGYVSARFHNTVVAAVCEMCLRIRKQEGLNRVCLSGGVFQNMYLLKHSLANLRRDRFDVFYACIGPAERRRHLTGAGGHCN